MHLQRCFCCGPGPRSSSVPPKMQNNEIRGSPVDECLVVDLNASSDEGSIPIPRKRQFVSTLSSRKRVAEWMIDEEMQGRSDRIASRAVRQFLELFRGSANAALTKASRWWRSRHNTLLQSKERGSMSVSGRRDGLRRRFMVKAAGGRGRKRSDWVVWLHGELVEEFDRLRKAGLKFTPATLRHLAMNILEGSSGSITSSFVDNDGKTLNKRSRFDGSRRLWKGIT